MDDLEDVVEAKVDLNHKIVQNSVFRSCLTFNRESKFLVTRTHDSKKGSRKKERRCSLVMFDLMRGKFSSIGVWRKVFELFKWDERSYFVYYKCSLNGLVFYKMNMLPPYGKRKKLKFTIRKPRMNLRGMYTPLDIVSNVRKLKRISDDKFCGISFCFLVVFSIINDIDAIKVLRIFRQDDESKIRYHFPSKIHENSVYVVGDSSLQKPVSILNFRENTSKSFHYLKLRNKRIGDVQLLTKHSGNRKFEFLVYSCYPSIIIEYLYDSDVSKNKNFYEHWVKSKKISNLAENDWIRRNRKFQARDRSLSVPFRKKKSKRKKSEIDKLLILEQNYVFIYSGSKEYFQVDQLHFTEEEKEGEKNREYEEYKRSLMKRNELEEEEEEEEEEARIKASRMKVMKERIRCKNLKSIEILGRSLNSVKFLFLQNDSFKIVSVSGLNVLETSKYVQNQLDLKERIMYLKQRRRKMRRRRRRKRRLKTNMKPTPFEGVLVSIRFLRNNRVIDNIFRSILY